MELRFDYLLESLPIVLKGMLGIFIVIGIILLCTMALNAVFKD